MQETIQNIKELSPLQRAFVTIKEMRSKLDAFELAATEAIAIVGIGCRFPGGAKDSESFWQILRDGVDTIKEVPADRWNIDAYYDPNPETPGKMYARQGGFLENIDEFDADFFDIHPREARSMDPQQRLLLEVSWEALENAGTPPDKLGGSQTGVFVGIGVNEYSQLALSGSTADIDVYAATGNALSVAAGRLSYNLGLEGPALAVDTACSSSLVAVHLACSSLRSGECDLALAGGAYLMQSPLTIIAMSKLRALSADGRCKTFDAAADGYGRGEGCGMVVLKRLRDAVADGDNILASIRGTAVNQDGRSSGLTVPNSQAQQRVIRAALANAKVDPAEISYVEAHGTGTSLGDPLEVKALAAVLRNRNSGNGTLMLGSVKTNIGHLEAAAGIASLIKVVLAMQHREIPPHLHFTELNPHISTEAAAATTIPTKLTPWLSEKNGKLLAGISSFGFSGTNSHLVLESPLPRVKEGKSGAGEALHLLTLSAKTETALLELASRYRGYLETHLEVELADICFTANTGRAHFAHRLAVVASSHEEMAAQLTEWGTGNGLKPPKLPMSDPLSDLATAYIQGVDIDWTELDYDCQRRRVQLPTYPFQRERYWINTDKTSTSPLSKGGRGGFSEIAHPLLDKRLFSPLEQVQFESQFSLERLPLVGDHRMDDLPVVNLVVYLEMAVAAAREVFWENRPQPPFERGEMIECYRWEDVSISQALVMPETDSRRVQLILSSEGEGETGFKIFSLPAGAETAWTLHASGGVCLSKQPAREKMQSELTLEELLRKFPEQFREQIACSEFYPMVEKRGVQLGKSCQLLDTVWRGDGEAIAKMKPQENFWGDLGYLLPLGAIDAWIQILSACFPADIPQMYLLVGLECFQFYGYSGQKLWGRAKLDTDKNVDKYEETIHGDLWLFDETGALVAEITKAQLKRVSFETLRRADKASNKAAKPQRQSRISKETVFAIAPTDRPHLLEKYLIEELAIALQSSKSKISSGQPLATLVDSLMAFELRNRIESDLQVRLPVENFLGESNIAELALALLEQLTLANLTLTEQSPLSPPRPPSEGGSQDLENENSEELEEIVL